MALQSYVAGVFWVSIVRFILQGCKRPRLVSDVTGMLKTAATCVGVVGIMVHTVKLDAQHQSLPKGICPVGN